MAQRITRAPNVPPLPKPLTPGPPTRRHAESNFLSVYAGLRCGEQIRPVLDGAALLVKPEVAATQREKDLASQGAGVTGTGGEGGTGQPGTTTTTDGGDGTPPNGETVTPLPTRFYGTVALDATRLGRDAGSIAEEVIAHLTPLEGANVRITLDIQADVPGGVQQAIVRAVTENCQTLKFDTHGFENA